MKKLLSILLTVCMLVTMAACSGGGDSSSKADSSKADSSKADSPQASAGEESKADSVADKYADTIKMVLCLRFQRIVFQTGRL